jgi:hypothetical protein
MDDKGQELFGRGKTPKVNCNSAMLREFEQVTKDWNEGDE